jgi:hypothetical protein
VDPSDALPKSRFDELSPRATAASGRCVCRSAIWRRLGHLCRIADLADSVSHEIRFITVYIVFALADRYLGSRRRKQEPTATNAEFITSPNSGNSRRRSRLSSAITANAAPRQATAPMLTNAYTTRLNAFGPPIIPRQVPANRPPALTPADDGIEGWPACAKNVG